MPTTLFPDRHTGHVLELISWIYANTCELGVQLLLINNTLRLDKFNFILSLVVKANLSSGLLQRSLVKFLEELLLASQVG